MPSHGLHNSLAVEQRRHFVASQYIKGDSQWTIAQATGVTQQQICADLKVIREKWLHSMLRDFDALKSEELAKIDAIETEAWKAWQASLEPYIVRVREKVMGPQGTVAKVVRRRERRIGDPRYLERIQKCVDQRCAILGLLAPVDVNQTLTVVVEDRTRLANERLLRLRHAPDSGSPETLAS
jgi:hypothetical protein